MNNFNNRRNKGINSFSRSYFTKYRIIPIICIIVLTFSCQPKTYSDGYITYEQVKLTEADKQILEQTIQYYSKNYDPEEKMFTREITSWNAHTIARSGVVHQIRGSFYFARALLDYGDKKDEQMAFDIIERSIALQESDPNSRICGVWAYYLEEPASMLKSKLDVNMADFNAVALLDIYMGHKNRIPEELQQKIRDALIRAAQFIQKRDVSSVYTNIAIMATYVTYMTAHLFDLPDMKIFAKDKLQRFYDFTLENNGFAEYNCPGYTILALDELFRMQQHIIEADSRKMIDSLYATGWDMIARHYHKPTAQWAGPHGRSSRTLVSTSFYGLLNQASGGKIDLGYTATQEDVKIKHKIPEHLLHYFINPEYPRCEIDTFEKKELGIVGTTYMTGKYAVSSVTKASLWNQRRPFLAYWGTQNTPSYLRGRLLHEFEDLSTATFYSEQKKNNIIAAINFATNGAYQHLYSDELHGIIETTDLRLRFEFGNVKQESITTPEKDDALVSFSLDGLQFNLQLFYADFSGYQGYWEKGGNENISWIDYVIYSGTKKVIDLNKMESAVLGFIFNIGEDKENYVKEKPEFKVKDGVLDAQWNNVQINIPVKPTERSKYLYL